MAIDIYEKVTQIALKNEIQKSAVKFLTPREVLFEGGRDVELARQKERTGFTSMGKTVWKAFLWMREMR